MSARSAVLALMAVTATQSSGTGAQQPSFRAEVSYVEVDAFVTDQRGAVVRDLRREDFELSDGGQPQEIVHLSLVDLPVEPRPARGGPQFEADTASNASDGRVFLMLIEPLLVPRDVAAVRRAQNVAVRFVDEALGAGDLMAVVPPRGSVTHAQGFTSNKSLLRASIEQLPRSLVAVAGPSPDGVSLCDPTRLRFTYDTIEEVSTRLGAISGRRKVILWIGGRVPFDPAADCGLQGAAASSVAFMHRDAIRAATRNNVAIYPIDPLGATAAGVFPGT